jgi:hypothetical protein
MILTHVHGDEALDAMEAEVRLSRLSPHGIGCTAACEKPTL